MGMKKLAVLVMALVLCLTAVSAMAETVTANDAGSLWTQMQKIKSSLTENLTIEITKDITIGSEWDRLVAEIPAGITVTIQGGGSGKELKGLKLPLVSKVSGKGNLSFKNLTISGSDIKSVDYNGGIYSAAAFTAYVDMSGDLSFTNCHVKNSNVIESTSKSQSYAGGFVAYVNKPIDIKMTGCSLSDSKVESNGQAGGLIAYANCKDHTVELLACAVTDSTVVTNEIENGEPRTDKVGAFISTNNDGTNLIVDNFVAVGNNVSAAGTKVDAVIGRNNGAAAKVTVTGDCESDMANLVGKNKGTVDTTKAFIAPPAVNVNTGALPQTGDNSSLMLWAGMMALAMVGFVASRKTRLN